MKPEYKFKNLQIEKLGSNAIMVKFEMLTEITDIDIVEYVLLFWQKENWVSDSGFSL